MCSHGSWPQRAQWSGSFTPWPALWPTRAISSSHRSPEPGRCRPPRHCGRYSTGATRGRSTSPTGRSGRPCVSLSPLRPTSSTDTGTLEGAERRLWQVTLAAYALLTLSLFGDYFTPWMEQMFIVGIGAMMVIGLVGIALGIMMLRNGFRPRTTPILLMSFIPFMVAVTSVTSLGSALLPLMWGWAIAAQAVVARKGESAETVVVSTDRSEAVLS